jgi:hypothetical protein
MLKLPGSWFAQLRLGIAPDGAALLKVKGRSRHHSVIADSKFLPETPEALPDRIRTLLANTRCANMPVTVVLADQWVRLFMVTPPHNATNLRDLEAATAMRFQELYGESIAAWQLSAHWNARQPFLACATPRPVIAALQQLAHEYRWKVLSIAPHFITAWNRYHKQLDGKAWFGVTHQNLLTLAAIEQGQLRAMGVSKVDEGIWRDEQALRTHLQREALRMNLPSAQQVHLCGYIPNLPAANATISSFCRQLDTIALPAGASAAVALARTGVPP